MDEIFVEEVTDAADTSATDSLWQCLASHGHLKFRIETAYCLLFDPHVVSSYSDTFSLQYVRSISLTAARDVIWPGSKDKD